MMCRWVPAALCTSSSPLPAISSGVRSSFFFFSPLLTTLLSSSSSFAFAWWWFQSDPSPSLCTTRSSFGIPLSSKNRSSSFPDSSPLPAIDSHISFSLFLPLLLYVCCLCALSWPPSSPFFWIFVPAAEGVVSAPKNRTPFLLYLAAAPLQSLGAALLPMLFVTPSLFAWPAGGDSSSSSTSSWFSTSPLGFPPWTGELSLQTERCNSTLAVFLRPPNSHVFSFKIASISIAATMGVCCSLSHCNFLCFMSSLIVEDSGDNSCLFLDLGVT